jgi:hypothetical protein
VVTNLADSLLVLRGCGFYCRKVDRSRKKAETLKTDASGFEVDPLTDLLGGWVEMRPRAVIRLGRMESRWYSDALKGIGVSRPVFIAGLARSGTTILLEFAAGLAGVATHRYRDFPFVHAPLWWNRFLDTAPRKKLEAVERSHRDGIAVTSDSPEAMEEPVWMSFFPDTHTPSVSHVLDGSVRNDAFDSFFVDHVRKILLLRKGTRYVSKNNYNITRMRYLLRLFPDARFVVPVREPADHVASLMRQQKIFSEGQRRNPKARAHLRRVGHFEFGIDRRAINFGNPGGPHDVEALWEHGDEVRGWARYWRTAVDFLAAELAADRELRRATLVVSYERFCAEPATVLGTICGHCEFDCAGGRIAGFTGRVRAPQYYERGLSDADLAVIREETAGALLPHELLARL